MTTRRLLLFGIPACAALLWLTLGRPRAHAGLEFTPKIQRLECDLDEKEVRTAFAFRNTGDHTVEIREVKPSCSCLTVSLAARSIAPGGTGEISAVFAPGGRRGGFQNFISIFTKGDLLPTLLEVQVQVEAPVVISPPLLHWARGGPVLSQQAEVLIRGAQPMELTQASDPGHQFDVKLREVEKGRRYSVEIRPRETARNASAEIALTFRSAANKERSDRIYARVR